MERKRLVLTVLLIPALLCLAGITRVSARALQADGARSPSRATVDSTEQTARKEGASRQIGVNGADIRRLLPDLLDWQQANSNGFGTQNATEVSALQAFGGHLYAGTSNATDGALILRSADGVTWNAVTQPGFGISHDTAPPAILDMEVFGGYIYASTGRGDGPGQIWRALSGLNWAPMVIAGFADPDTVDITALASYNGMIYAGATNLTKGAQIWRSYTGDSNSWTQVAPATPGAAAATVTGLSVFDGALYAVVQPDGPVQIWRTYGSGWTTVVDDGFGNNLTTTSGGMAEFAGYLYVGAGNGSAGAQLWRSNDGTNWQQAITPGSGDANNVKVESVFVFQNKLYVAVRNSVTGLELWRSADGSVWEQTNQDGFGDANNTATNGSNATTNYSGTLFVGTVNVAAGGELWRMTPPALYDVALSAGDSLAGLAGQTVTYTLTVTNSGTVADSYDLTVAGNGWPTALSLPTIALGPGASSAFSVSVSIPSSAAVGDFDGAAVTATSQGDSSKSDGAQLTTTVLSTYGVLLSADAASSGLPDHNVIYTLTITNTGGTADTFDLAVTGNSWPILLSTTAMALAPGATGTFTVAVGIPVSASDHSVDHATVTATSRGDHAAADSAILTTTCLTSPPQQTVFLPSVLRAP